MWRYCLRRPPGSVEATGCIREALDCCSRQSAKTTQETSHSASEERCRPRDRDEFPGRGECHFVVNTGSISVMKMLARQKRHRHEDVRPATGRFDTLRAAVARSFIATT